MKRKFAKAAVGLLCLMVAFSLISVGFARDVAPKAESKWTSLINQVYEQVFSNPDVLAGWKEGIKEDYNLDLQKIVHKAVVVREEGCLNYAENTHVFVILNIRVLALDANGNKKSLMIVREIFVEINHVKGIVLGSQATGELRREVVDGWDGKDI